MSLLALIFVVLAVALRLLPHPFHFTPIAAALLFFGAKVERKYFWLPVALVVASDCYLTLFHYHYEFSWTYLAASIAWYSAMVWVGSLLMERESVSRIAGASLAASISFFLVSNGVSPWTIPGAYSRDLHGVGLALTAGVPFFRSTIVGDLFFSAVAFGSPFLIGAAERTIARLRGARGQVTTA